MKQLVAGVVGALCVSGVSLGQATYVYDDGSGFNSGPGPVGTPGVFVWGNVFDVADGASEITAVHVALGSVPAGAEVVVLVFEDPTDDGNPDDAILLTAQAFSPWATSSNTFTEVEITPTRVAGKFFVACTTAVNGTSATYAARVDPSSGQQWGARAFFYWGPGLNPYTLSGWSNRAQYVGTATAMVRAVGRVPAPPCAADVGAAGGVPGSDGAADNNDFVAFIDLFFGRDARADMGSAGGLAGADGAFDNNDFVVFIDRFFSCGP